MLPRVVMPRCSDKYDYTCTFCGTSVGDKMVTERDNLRVLLK